MCNYSNVGIGRAHPQTVPTKLGAWNLSQEVSCSAEALRVSFTGTKRLGPTPHHNPPTTKLYTWHNALRQVKCQVKWFYLSFQPYTVVYSTQ